MDQQATYALQIKWSEDWWKKTKNPLHVWRAIAICLNADPPASIPNWCLPYLASAASNINSLTLGWDFRDDHPRVSPAEAYALTTAALGLGKQGKKSSFTSVREDADSQLHALDAELGRNDVIKSIAKERSISKDRAARRLAHGKRLARLG
jgi:hypothetical protein